MPPLHITVTGGSKPQRELVKEASDWCLRKLFAKSRLRSEITVDIALLNEPLTSGELTRGMTIPESKREYVIELDARMNMMGVLKTLAHECVHVFQFCTREMSDTPPESIAEYFADPTEIEAFMAEVHLVHDITAEKRYNEKPWYFDEYYIER